MSELIRLILPWRRRDVEPAKEQRPFDFYFVVADDEEHFLKRSSDQLKSFLAQFPGIRAEVAMARSTSEVFSKAMRGNFGRKASFVLIDYALEHDTFRWSFEARDVLSWSEKLGINFPINQTGREVPLDILDNRLSSLSLGGYKIALLLRMAGYSGTISVLSNSNTQGVQEDNDRWTHYRLREIREVIPDLVIKEPIVDKVLLKDGFTATEIAGHINKLLY